MTKVNRRIRILKYTIMESLRGDTKAGCCLEKLTREGVKGMVKGEENVGPCFNTNLSKWRVEGQNFLWWNGEYM